MQLVALLHSCTRQHFMDHSKALQKWITSDNS